MDSYKFTSYIKLYCESYKWSVIVIYNSRAVLIVKFRIKTSYGRDISRGIISRQKSGRVEIEIGEASLIF